MANEPEEPKPPGGQLEPVTVRARGHAGRRQNRYEAEAEAAHRNRVRETLIGAGFGIEPTPRSYPDFIATKPDFRRGVLCVLELNEEALRLIAHDWRNADFIGDELWVVVREEAELSAERVREAAGLPTHMIYILEIGAFEAEVIGQAATTSEPDEKPKDVTLRPGLFVNQSTFYSPTVTQGPPPGTSTRRVGIARTVAANRDGILRSLMGMSLLIADRMTTLKDALRGRNDWDVTETRARQAELDTLEELTARVEALEKAVKAYQPGKDDDSKVVKPVERLSEYLGNWAEKDHVAICSITFRSGIFSLLAGFCSMLGASGDVSALVPGVLVSGQLTVEALKHYAASTKKSED